MRLAFFHYFCDAKVSGNLTVKDFVVKKNNVKKNVMMTGEFARLCKTTKATLFHYDQENLLKPKYVSENGYRHYGVEQFFDFDMITMLKETGSSLQEIKTCIHNTDSEGFLSLLEAKRLVIKKERERLAQREQTLRDLAACTREALDFDYDTFMVREQEEEHLETFSTTPVTTDSMPEFVERFTEYIDFYEKQKRIPRYPFGVIVNRDDVQQARYLERYFFSRATRSTPRSQLHLKPQGRYAVIAHQGTVQTHLETFGELLRHIRAAGLTVAGNAYVYDMMSYILQGPGKRYAAKYCVRVE